MSALSTPVTIADFVAAQAAYAEIQAKLAESVKHAEGYSRQVAKRTPLVAAAKAELDRVQRALEAQMDQKKSA